MHLRHVSQLVLAFNATIDIVVDRTLYSSFDASASMRLVPMLALSQMQKNYSKRYLTQSKANLEKRPSLGRGRKATDRPDDQRNERDATPQPDAASSLWREWEERHRREGVNEEGETSSGVVHNRIAGCPRSRRADAGRFRRGNV